MKPRRLQVGDTIGIVSPSWFGGEPFVARAKRGAARLESLGFKVRFGEHALNNAGDVSDTAENRAKDIHTFFADPEVRAIISTIGGDHFCHLLPLLDWELIGSNPKIFMGFSDITVLNVAIWRMTGLTTFNGPALMTDWAEFPSMPVYSQQSALRTLCDAEPPGVISPAPWWTEEFLDWSTGEDLTRPRKQNPSDGWTWLRAGQAEGVLIGGCLESLQHLRGTRFWPEAWDGVILFLETSEECPSPAKVDGILTDYENMGVLERIGGLLMGRSYRYSNTDRQALHEVLLGGTKRYRIPIVADMDFGHTTPVFTLPIGCRARIDGVARQFSITEAAAS